MTPRTYAVCDHQGCQWSQVAENLDDAFGLIALHAASAHGWAGRFHAPVTPPRPNAIDYMLSCPEFFQWRVDSQ